MRFPLALLFSTALLLSACGAVVDVPSDQGAAGYAVSPASDAASQMQPAAPVPAASCPCFSRSSLSDSPIVSQYRGVGVPAPYLFFDAFNYYGLDMRRTEVRATIHSEEGTFEEVAAVYITPDNDGLHLICTRQELVRHQDSGDLTYRYQTLAPTVDEAEACRLDLAGFVGEREPCQGAACGIPYSDAQLDPDSPPYHDGNFDTPKSVLNEMRLEVERVSRMLQVLS
jgi:hypothetical protein